MHRTRELAVALLALAGWMGSVTYCNGDSEGKVAAVSQPSAHGAVVGKASPGIEAGVPDSENFAPFVYWRNPDAYGRPNKLTAAGPIFSHREFPKLEVTSVRPLYAQFDDATIGETRRHLLYPFFNYSTKGEEYAWDIFSLIIGERQTLGDGQMLGRFEVWPFFWNYDTGSEATSYWALMPLYGEFKQRFFADHIRFVLFPFYLRVQTKDEVNTSVPWPFVQILTGPESRGFSLWPLFGHTERDNKYDRFFAVWPLIYDNKENLDQPVPSRKFGALPFYAQENGPGLMSETYVWPFFGYTKESAPRKTYDETRYFWPFFVQGRGEEKSINRWMPFYTHETREDYSKTWYLWPLVKHSEWQDRGLQIERDQFLYFLWWDERQSALDGKSDFFARKTHLWPLFSYWNNGAGTRQFQTLSPLEVFYPHNDVIREKYSPLFALYRYDQRPQSITHSVLWDLVSVENSGDEGVLQVGPLFEMIRSGDHAYVEFLKGFVGYGNEDGTRKLKLLWKEW